MMSFRERYLEALLFGKPDRVPLLPGGPRESTLRAWHQQGLPKGQNYFTALLQELDLPVMPGGVHGLGVSFIMIPTFEEKVLEHRDGHYIVRDWMGAITEISDEFDYTYIRSAKDFVTRKWHKFPVENHADWEKMKLRYSPDDPKRFPPDFARRCRELRQRDVVVSVQVNGPFWQLREWCGFENLCLLFLDDPDFVREMILFWTDFVSAVLERIFSHITLDRLGISEDMAFKERSMISPGMTAEFLVPTYEKWVKQVRAAGCPVIDMDSDGYIGELIPLWIGAGINVCDPIEVAAGNDIVAFRREFGRNIGYTGGIDKRAIAKGGRILEEEVLRVVPPLFAQGGFIPGCDHGVPSDISWPNFIEYTRLVAQLSGWL